MLKELLMEPEIYVGHFKCQDPRRGMEDSGCGKEWHAQVGPGRCPDCLDSQPYITWLNYPVEKPLFCSICNTEFKKV